MYGEGCSDKYPCFRRKLDWHLLPLMCGKQKRCSMACNSAADPLSSSAVLVRCQSVPFSRFGDSEVFGTIQRMSFAAKTTLRDSVELGIVCVNPPPSRILSS